MKRFYKTTALVSLLGISNFSYGTFYGARAGWTPPHDVAYIGDVGTVRVLTGATLQRGTNGDMWIEGSAADNAFKFNVCLLKLEYNTKNDLIKRFAEEQGEIGLEKVVAHVSEHLNGYFAKDGNLDLDRFEAAIECGYAIECENKIVGFIWNTSRTSKIFSIKKGCGKPAIATAVLGGFNYNGGIEWNNGASLMALAAAAKFGKFTVKLSPEFLEKFFAEGLITALPEELEDVANLTKGIQCRRKGNAYLVARSQKIIAEINGIKFSSQTLEEECLVVDLEQTFYCSKVVVSGNLAEMMISLGSVHFETIRL
jgi:hypothetical protein